MYVITIDTDLCEGDGECVDTCAVDILSIVEEDGKKHAVVSGDPDECLGCMSCEAVCAQGAITVTEY
jgi:NAD-dependent dihydropyrimidine dehydrogenase PreA subunit